MIKYCFESTRVRSSDWIERLPAEEEVVRSNRTGLTMAALSVLGGSRRVGRTVMRWFRKPMPFWANRFDSCTLRIISGFSPVQELKLMENDGYIIRT